MDLVDDLKQYLETSLKVAEGLHAVSKKINPERKVSVTDHKRMQLIRKDICEVTQYARVKQPSTCSREHTSQSTRKPHSEVIRDVPCNAIKRILSNSIKDVNSRVKFSRAGKRSVAQYLSREARVPSVFRTAEQFSSYVKALKQPVKNAPPEALLPYVSLVTGAVETPIALPTFEEFLNLTGEDFLIKTGSDELMYRIEKASEQLEQLQSKLRETIEDRGAQRLKAKLQKLGTVRHPGMARRNSAASQASKLKERLERYCPSREKTITHVSSEYLEADASLEEQLRGFYKTKSTENQKLLDILMKLNENRALNIQKKVSLLSRDNERYKNQLHSLSKFNKYRHAVEALQRERQQQNYSQGLVYVQILDNLRVSRHQPSPNERLLLEVWRRTVERGWPIESDEFHLMTGMFSIEELRCPSLQTLLEQLKASVVTCSQNEQRLK